MSGPQGAAQNPSVGGIPSVTRSARGVRATIVETARICRCAVPWLDWQIEGDRVVGTGDILVCTVEAGRLGPAIRSLTLRKPLAWPVDDQPVSGPALRVLRANLQRRMNHEHG